VKGPLLLLLLPLLLMSVPAAWSKHGRRGWGVGVGWCLVTDKARARRMVLAAEGGIRSIALF